MTAQHLFSVTARVLAALAVALLIVFAIAGGAASPAAADNSQWVIRQPHWWDNSGSSWRHQQQWRTQWNGQGQNQWHNHWHNQWQWQHHHFNGFHNCFNCGCPIIVFNGGGVFFSSPGFVVGNPAFIINQPAFIIRQPAFIIRPPFAVLPPRFVTVDRRFHHHNHMQPGQPMHRPMFIRPGGSSGSVRIVTPGM